MARRSKSGDVWQNVSKAKRAPTSEYRPCRKVHTASLQQSFVDGMGSPDASLTGAEGITQARVGILVAVWDHLLKCKTRHNYLRKKRTNGDFHVSLSFTECIANPIKKMGQGVAEHEEIK